MEFWVEGVRLFFKGSQRFYTRVGNRILVGEDWFLIRALWASECGSQSFESQADLPLVGLGRQTLKLP